MKEALTNFRRKHPMSAWSIYRQKCWKSFWAWRALWMYLRCGRYALTIYLVRVPALTTFSPDMLYAARRVAQPLGVAFCRAEDGFPPWDAPESD